MDIIPGSKFYLNYYFTQLVTRAVTSTLADKNNFFPGLHKHTTKYGGGGDLTPDIEEEAKKGKDKADKND